MAQIIESLLNEVHFKIATLREARSRFADQLAPDFNFFDYLRADEIGLSRCFADLLNPKGKHGQGSIFLDEFIKLFPQKIIWRVESNDFLNLQLEKQANGQERIDIYLEFSKGIIGIENKPWAGFQDKQLDNYANYLESTSRDKNWLLVLFCNREPEKDSYSPQSRQRHEEDSRFIHLTFTDLIQWLDVCSKNAKALVVRIYIEELAKFIRTDINGYADMPEAVEVKNAVLKSDKTLESAFQICNSMDDVKKELLEKFQEKLKEDLKTKEFKLKDWKLDNSGAHIGFNIQFGENHQNLFLRFQFYRTNLNDFFWGIRRRDEDYKDEQKWNEINSLMSQLYKQSKIWESWPWHIDCPNKYFDRDMQNWAISPKPWLLISNGELSTKIVKVAEDVYEVFKKNDCLELLY